LTSCRAFVGLDVSGPALRALEAVLDLPVPTGWRVTRVPLHITLAYIGACSDEVIDRVVDAVRDVAVGVLPVVIDIGGVGRFTGSGSSGVVWAGVGDATGGLADLAERTRRAVGRAVEFDDRLPFVAHVTMWRVRPPDSPLPLDVESNLDALEVPMAVTALTLFIDRGAGYAPERRSALGSGTQRPSSGT
jgi:2'-5' RNA ligase